MILQSSSIFHGSLLAISLALYAWTARNASKNQTTIPWLLGAWLAHTAWVLFDLLGPAPRFGFAPALSATGCLVTGVYLIEHRLYPQFTVRWPLPAVASATLVLQPWFPGHPLAANASWWLPMHWMLGIAAYGLLAAAAIHAWIMTQSEQQLRQHALSDAGLPLLTLERLTFHFVQAGFALLSATLLAGVLFDLTDAGVRWQWNHKTVFSLLSWLVLAILLWGRHRWGWRGKRAAHWVYGGVGLLMLAYVGSRFVIEVILGRP